MVDTRLRKLERNYKESDTYEDYLALFRERLRAGSFPGYKQITVGNYYAALRNLRREAHPQHPQNEMKDWIKLPVAFYRPFNFRETVQALVVLGERDNKEYWKRGYNTCTGISTNESGNIAKVRLNCERLLTLDKARGFWSGECSDREIAVSITSENFDVKLDEMVDQPLLLTAIENDKHLLRHFRDVIYPSFPESVDTFGIDIRKPTDYDLDCIAGIRLHWCRIESHPSTTGHFQFLTYE
jgi:hypothetical protein